MDRGKENYEIWEQNKTDRIAPEFHFMVWTQEIQLNVDSNASFEYKKSDSATRSGTGRAT
jgi:hypothetical protein